MQVIHKTGATTGDATKVILKTGEKVGSGSSGGGGSGDMLKADYDPDLVMENVYHRGQHYGNISTQDLLYQSSNPLVALPFMFGTYDGQDLIFMTDSVERMRISKSGVFTGLPVTADMLKSVYDPSSVNDDAFDRMNHYGNMSTTNLLFQAGTTSQFGTFDNQDLAFITNSVERMRISKTGVFSGITIPKINRFVLLTDAATVTPNADTTDIGILTTLSQPTTIANPTGSPFDGQRLTLKIKSTTARALTWGSQYRASGAGTLPTTTTGGSAIDIYEFLYNNSDTKWDFKSDLSGAGGGGDMLAATYDPNTVHNDAFDSANHYGDHPDKNASNGFPGLAGYKIMIYNDAGNVLSWLRNNNSTARTYTFRDRDATAILDNTDLANIQNDFMDKATYDPTNIDDDAFDRANHSGYVKTQDLLYESLNPAVALPFSFGTYDGQDLIFRTDNVERMRISESGLFTGNGVLAFDQESIDLFARMTTVSMNRKILIDWMIKRMKSAGIWAKLDAFYFLAGENSQQALLNWKSTSFNATTSGTLTFTQDQGFKSNGSTGYINTNYTPSTAGGNFTLNDAGISIYIREDILESGWDCGVHTGSTGLAIDSKDGFQFYYMVNDASFDAFVNATSDAFYSCVRTSSSTKKAYKNGSLAVSTTRTSVSLPTDKLLISASQYFGTPSTFGKKQTAIFAIHSSLDATQASDFNDIVEQGMRVINSGVAVKKDIAFLKNYGSEAAGAVTVNDVQEIIITTSSLTTAAGGTYTFTCTSNKIATTSRILHCLQNGTNTVDTALIQKVQSGAGSCTVVIWNRSATTALNGSLEVTLIVLN